MIKCVCGWNTWNIHYNNVSTYDKWAQIHGMFNVDESNNQSSKKKRKKILSKRKDGVDEIYQETYHCWVGWTHKGKHPSHIVQGQKKIYPPNQLIPGYCLLCLITSVQATLYRYKRHYRLCHIKHAVVIGCITLLACKCSEIKSQGTNKSCRNQHYHCHLCHWPKTSKEALFIHYTTQHEVKYELVGHLVKKVQRVN